MRAALLVCLAACGRIGFSDVSASGDALHDDARHDGISTTDYAATVLLDKPVGYWRLDDTTTAIADITGHGHDGVAMPGTTLGQPGLLAQANAAVAFDGATGYITVPDSPALSFNTALTVEAWVTPARFDNAASGGFPRIVQKGAGGVIGYDMQFEPSSGTAALLRMELEGTTVTNFDGTTSVIAGTTHHLVGTYDGTAIRLYVDGQLDNSTPCTGTVNPTLSPLEIGRRPDAMRYLEGVVDEVAVYDKALTAGQIAAHYAAGR